MTEIPDITQLTKPRSNPWLKIPLADYEGHMNSAEVQQLGALSDLFGEALGLCKPASVAVLGVAGGNGLERIDSQITRRVVGVDLNPAYLEAARKRFSSLMGLELCCSDLAEQSLELATVEMVHAALVFEHAGTERCLENAIALVAPGGALSVVLQLPSEVEKGVSASSFASMQELKSHFTFVDPKGLCDVLSERNFRLIHEARRALPAGKAFWMGIFRRP